MAEWVTVLSLLVFGLGLLFLELLFIPGTTLSGVAGLISCFLGVTFAFTYFGPDIGMLVLLASSGAVFLGGYLSFRQGTWHRLALHKVLKNRVNDTEEPLVIGEVGKAISDLRPIGKADFNGHHREVSTLGYHVNTGREVRIVKIIGKKIYVEPIKEIDLVL